MQIANWLSNSVEPDKWQFIVRPWVIKFAWTELKRAKIKSVEDKIIFNVRSCSNLSICIYVERCQYNSTLYLLISAVVFDSHVEFLKLVLEVLLQTKTRIIKWRKSVILVYKYFFKENEMYYTPFNLWISGKKNTNLLSTYCKIIRSTHAMLGFYAFLGRILVLV